MRHLLLVSVENPHDPRAWSGTPFNILKSLEKHFDQVTVISSPVPRRSYFGGLLRLLLGRKHFPLWMTTTALKSYAQKLDEGIRRVRPDAVLCISSQHLIYAKERQLPIFMISDAPWIAYKEAYQKYERLPLLSGFYARREAEVANRISGVIYPTPWACNEARLRFSLAPERVHRLPFGANSHCSHTDEQVADNIRGKQLHEPNFLFVGKDWERKGGPMALDIVRQLVKSGIDARLSIAGCDPQIDEADMRWVHKYGYLSPAKESDKATLAAAFTQADFFLVPSHAECFGLVFAEAQSYGLPCISLNNQGIPGVVVNEVTGLLYDSPASAELISDDIIQLIANPASYRIMAFAARKKYTAELNWDSFGTRIHKLISSK